MLRDVGTYVYMVMYILKTSSLLAIDILYFLHENSRTASSLRGFLYGCLSYCRPSHGCDPLTAASCSMTIKPNYHAHSTLGNARAK